MSTIYLIALAQTAGVAPGAPLETLPSPPPVQRDIAPLPPPPSVPNGRPATPIGNPGNWILTDDYPAIALRQNWTGITAFRLTIGLSGYVVGCDITRTSGYAVLDQTTCTLITQRASFRPARDAQGKPVVGYYSSRVRWELPTLDNPFASPDGSFSPVAITWRFFIEPDGSTSDCVVSDGNTMMQTAESGSPCDPEFHYKPFTDANGKPVRKRVFYRMESGYEPDSKP